MITKRNYRLLMIMLAGAILINLLIAAFLLRKIYWTYPHPSSTASSNKISYFLNRQQHFEVFPKDSNSIVFLGNSLTQLFEAAELLKDLRIKNRGIYGDVTAGVLNRITPVIALHPSKVFIEIGLNDLLHGLARDTVLRNYEKIIDTLQARGGTRVYVQSLLPVATTGEAANVPHINDDIRYLNDHLKQYATLRKATYVDLYAHFSLNGTINPKYFISDGEHISGEGYLLWADLVRPYVNE